MPIFQYSIIPLFRPYLLCHLGERFIQDSHHLIDLLLRDDKWGSEEQMVSFDPIRAAAAGISNKPFGKG
jgi:hypothetical protein